jgi:heme A synthase
LTAPDIYADYIKALVESEDARKSSLEQRGAGVITTSSALATLLFALVGVVTASKNFSLPTAAHGYLVAAIALFAVAVTIGILANLPLLYKQAAPTAEGLADVWDYSVSDAEAYVIATRLKVLESARRSNAVKSWLVLLAGVVQLAALVMLVFGVLAILSGNPHPVNH